jgi:hypothetical protein
MSAASLASDAFIAGAHPPQPLTELTRAATEKSNVSNWTARISVFIPTVRFFLGDRKSFIFRRKRRFSE